MRTWAILHSRAKPNPEIVTKTRRDGGTVDTLPSGGSARKRVEVRILFPVPNFDTPLFALTHAEMSKVS
jgi:hypothetical protein